MKRQHITLPVLHLAAAAFFATNVQAEYYCVDKFADLIEGPPDATPEDLVMVACKRDEGTAAGGFGRRQMGGSGC
ncbi:hypothetical protein F4781DRAFT_440560 [Annulohypoxylon bovei var. microspora]|nr:hypothetical protein F4781DRAFT_440560 [Annulohypoxylon bovei var. microspora]